MPAARRRAVTVASYGRSDRLVRALRALGAWWGAALLGAFIPVAHFVLVPSLLLCGVVRGVQRAVTSTAITGGRGTCPDCGAEQELDLHGAWRLPRDVVCRQCRRGLRLHEGVVP